MRFLYLSYICFVLSACSSSVTSCGNKSLNNPRLDYIADTIADIKSKDNPTPDDFVRMKELQDEENAIWDSARVNCN